MFLSCRSQLFFEYTDFYYMTLTFMVHTGLYHLYCSNEFHFHRVKPLHLSSVLMCVCVRVSVIIVLPTVALWKAVLDISVMLQL